MVSQPKSFPLVSMITDFFTKSETMLALTHAAIVWNGRNGVGADETMHAVVEQMLPALMDSASTRKKLRPLVREDVMRRLLNNVVNEKEGFRIVTSTGTHSPSGAVSLSQLMHAQLGDGSAALSSWTRYVSDNRSALEPLFDVLDKHRRQSWEQQHMLYFQQQQQQQASGNAAAVVAVGGSGGGKRKSGAGAGAGASAKHQAPAQGNTSSGGSALVIVGEGNGGTELEIDQYDKAHRVMRDTVLSMESRSVSPPSSPSCNKKKKQPVLTVSERLQLRTHAVSRVSHTKSVTQLFEALNMDDVLIPDNYAPPFDRNDVYLTNLEDARKLVALASRVSTELEDRKMRGEPLPNFQELPSAKMVMIEYSGPLNDTLQHVVCGYVTWALQQDVRSGAFLTDVLNGSIRINNDFSELMDKVARLSVDGGNNAGAWKRRFTVQVIDDCHWFVSERRMQTFVAALDVYAEQYQCMGASMAGGGVPRFGLNMVHHNHGRHRLIYEAGSIQSYQQLWLFTHAKNNYERLCERMQGGVAELVDAVLTFWQMLCTGLVDVTRTDVDVAAELGPLGRLMSTKSEALSSQVQEVKKAHDMMMKVAARRRTVVQDAFAAARVREFRDNTPIPRGLVALNAAVNSGEADVHTEFADMVARAKRACDVFDVAASAWFFLGRASKTAHQQRHAVKDHCPLYQVRVLRALVLLGLWSPVPPSAALLAAPMDCTVPLPVSAPHTLDKQELRAVLLDAHPDSHRDKIKRARVDTTSLSATFVASAIPSAVIEARDLLKAHYAKAPLPSEDEDSASAAAGKGHADD
jgi:hypothetical protein